MLWTFVSKDFVMCSGLHPSMCAVHVRLSRDLKHHGGDYSTVTVIENLHV